MVILHILLGILMLPVLIIVVVLMSVGGLLSSIWRGVKKFFKGLFAPPRDDRYYNQDQRYYR